MSKGTPNSLRLEVLQGMVSKLTPSTDNRFLSLFGTRQYDSDTIRWAAEYGAMGMTPFAAPGAPAPVTTDDDWYNEGSARAAYYKEKKYFDESFLNNLANEINPLVRKTAQQTLARALAKLNYRCDRRREWMLAKMLFDGGFSYTQEKGLKFSVDYGIPSTHKVTLAGNDVWGTGSTRNPIEDIMDMKKLLKDDAGVDESQIISITTSEVLKLLMFDSNVVDLLKKSNFGNGDLYANPGKVIGTLLGVGELTTYDALYEFRSHIVGNVSAGSGTIVVEDITDFEIGGVARIRDMSKPRSWEDITITGINYTTNTITLASNTTGSYVHGRDVVICRKRFVSPNKFMMFSSVAEGQKIAEFMEAPYGMERKWGKSVDTKSEWDPDGIWLRVQDKGLPVLYNPETIVTLTVK